jgi:hypothetical protein
LVSASCPCNCLPDITYRYDNAAATDFCAALAYIVDSLPPVVQEGIDQFDIYTNPDLAYGVDLYRLIEVIQDGLDYIVKNGPIQKHNLEEDGGKWRRVMKRVKQLLKNAQLDTFEDIEVGDDGIYIDSVSGLLFHARQPSSSTRRHHSGARTSLLHTPFDLGPRSFALPAHTVDSASTSRLHTTWLINMLASPSKEEVARWREKSDIVLIDADSGSAPDGSVIQGLAGKFEREDFSGHVWFVRGGHAAAEAAGLPMVSDESDEEEDDDAEAASLAPTDNSLPAMTPPGSLKAGKLGRRAFQSGEYERARHLYHADSRRFHWKRPAFAHRVCGGSVGRDACAESALRSVRYFGQRVQHERAAIEIESRLAIPSESCVQRFHNFLAPRARRQAPACQSVL